MLEIRAETPDDFGSVYALNALAFPSDIEAHLVDVLRHEASSLVSLVAELDGMIVGHALFTPVELCGHGSLSIMGLGPMAVSPEAQNRGIGSQLVRLGLARCKELGAGGVVVVGHPTYYRRFGFVPAADYGITCEFDVPPGAFMALELIPDYFSDASGTARYHSAFGDAT